MTQPPRTHDAAELIAASGGGARPLAAAIAAQGAHRAWAVLIDEVAFRCGIAPPMFPVRVEIRVSFPGEIVRAALAFRAGEPVLAEDPGAGSGDIPVVCAVDVDAAVLAGELFGPGQDRSTPVCATRLAPALDAQPQSGMPDWALLDSASLAVDRVLGACSGRIPELGALALAHESDKWGMLHRFTPHYDRHLRHLRDEAVRVLEIGIGGYGDRPGGGSLAMWRRYFRRGLIFGLDVFDKSHVDACRVTSLVGDQNDPAFLRDLAARYGPFDVVIDDGSHVNEHVRTSFHALFEGLRPGGVYVIEDLWTSFRPGFGGVIAEKAHPSTSLGMVKDLVDGLHHLEAEAPGGGPDRLVTGLHVYHNITFVERGVNDEGRMPAWVPASIAEIMPAGG